MVWRKETRANVRRGEPAATSVSEIGLDQCKRLVRSQLVGSPYWLKGNHMPYIVISLKAARANWRPHERRDMT